MGLKDDLINELAAALAGLVREVRLHIDTGEVMPAADQKLMEAERALALVDEAQSKAAGK